MHSSCTNTATAVTNAVMNTAVTNTALQILLVPLADLYCSIQVCGALSEAAQSSNCTGHRRCPGLICDLLTASVGGLVPPASGTGWVAVRVA
eukprot:386527-Rhodomonas_salina.1